MPSLAKQGEPTQRIKIVQMNLEVVTFMALARQMNLWNSSVRCPRRMHLTSRLYREESHSAPDLRDRDAGLPPAGIQWRVSVCLEGRRAGNERDLSEEQTRNPRPMIDGREIPVSRARQPSDELLSCGPNPRIRV